MSEYAYKGILPESDIFNGRSHGLCKAVTQVYSILVPRPSGFSESLRTPRYTTLSTKHSSYGNETLQLFLEHVKIRTYPQKQKLKLYGLYKQAREGKCNRKKPPVYQPAALNKYEAWKAVEHLTIDQAMRDYVNFLKQVDKSFDVEKLMINSPEEREATIELNQLPPSVPPAFHGRVYRSRREIVKRVNSKVFDDLQVQGGYDPVNETYDAECRVELNERLVRFYREYDPDRLTRGIGEIVDYGLRKGEKVLNESLYKKYGTDLEEVEAKEREMFQSIRLQISTKQQQRAKESKKGVRQNEAKVADELMHDLELFFYKYDPERLQRGLKTGFKELLQYIERRGIDALNKKLEKKYGKTLKSVQKTILEDELSILSPTKKTNSESKNSRAASFGDFRSRVDSRLDLIPRKKMSTQSRGPQPPNGSEPSRAKSRSTIETESVILPGSKHYGGPHTQSYSSFNTLAESSYTAPFELPKYVEPALKSFYARYEPERLRDGSVNRVFLWARRNGLMKLNLELKRRYKQSLDEFIEESDKLRDDLLRFYRKVDQEKIKLGLDKILNWGVKNGRIALNMKLSQKYGFDLNTYNTTDLEYQIPEQSEFIEF